MKKLSFIPFICYIAITFFLMLLLTQTGNSYAWVSQGACFGTGCYVSGKKPGNFYEAAFAYEDTLVGFILLMVCLILIIVSLIVVLIFTIRKRLNSKALLIYNIVFAGIYFLIGLTMSIFMAECCYIDDGIGVPTFGFLSTFSSIPLAVFSIILLKNQKQ